MQQPAVCILTEDFYPPSRGGQERHAFDLASQLARAGCEVLVLTRKPDVPASPRERIGRICIRRIPPAGALKGRGVWALWPMLMYVGTVAFLLLKLRRQYDLVLVLGSKVLPIPVALASGLTRKPWFVKIESPVELDEQMLSDASLRRMAAPLAALLARSWRCLRANALQRADGYVAISLEIAQGLKRLGMDDGKIRAIRNGIDMRVFRPVNDNEKVVLRSGLGLPETGLIFAYTGRLATSKGLPYLLASWKTLVEAQPDLHLVLVGTGRGSFDDCEDELRAYVTEEGLEAFVTFAGEVEHVAAFLQAADLFVFPTDYEGFSLALAEAMACGLPVVATRVGAAPELVVDGVNGFLLEPRDVAQLRARLEWLAHHRESFPAMAVRARSTVADLCGLENIALQYIDLFNGKANARATAPMRPVRRARV